VSCKQSEGKLCKSILNSRREVRAVSKVLYIAIALLFTGAAALVLVQAKDSKRSAIHLQGPPAQSNAPREKLRNFDAQVVANAIRRKVTSSNI
jgi:hypothetical protein